jgi:hypothetical protein
VLFGCLLWLLSPQLVACSSPLFHISDWPHTHSAGLNPYVSLIISADFTLIICCESSVGEQSPALYGGNTVQQATEQEPGTPEKCLSPKSAAAVAAAILTVPADASTDAHAVAVDPPEAPNFSTAAADSPCSGQDHHGDHADILPQSPHRAAATAGVGPLSAVALQRSASQSLNQATAAPADSAGAVAAPVAQQPSKLRAIATSSAAAGSSSASSSKAEVATASSSSSSSVIVMPVHGELGHGLTPLASALVMVELLRPICQQVCGLRAVGKQPQTVALTYD